MRVTPPTPPPPPPVSDIGLENESAASFETLISYLLIRIPFGF